MRRWDLWALVALSLAAAVSGWWPDSRQTDGEPRISAEREPDYRMTRFELTAMNPQGTPLYRLTAASMRHYADDDSAEFDAPRLQYTAADAQGGEGDWTFHAEQARSTRQGAQIDLLGEVRIDGMMAPGQAPVSIETRDLVLFPAQKQARTDAAIRITQAQGRIEGVGLEADMQSGRIHLISQVRGYYAP